MAFNVPSFKEFVQNPLAVVAFCSLLAIGYLYVDTKDAYAEQRNLSKEFIEACESRELLQNREIEKLREDLSKLQDKFIKLVEISK